MIGELVMQKVDLGASPLFVTSDRIDVIDYLACTSQTRSKFVFRSPKLSFTDNVFLLPFDQHVWTCTIGLLVLTAVVLFISLFAEYKADIGNVDGRISEKPRMGKVFIIIY
jgi:glutamate receptor, ionotropic, invertebrate